MFPAVSTVCVYMCVYVRMCPLCACTTVWPAQSMAPGGDTVSVFAAVSSRRVMNRAGPAGVTHVSNDYVAGGCAVCCCVGLCVLCAVPGMVNYSAVL